MTKSSSDYDSLAALLNVCSDVVLLVDPESLEIVEKNAAFVRYSTPVEAGGSVGSLTEAMPDMADGAAMQQFLRVASGELEEARIQTSLLAKSGDATAGEAVLRRVIHQGAGVVGVVFRPHPAAQPAVVQQAMMRRDPLTGLADRSVLLERLESLLSSERCSAPQFALLFVDLNDFKQVNDQWGHVVGDGLVADVARRLASCVRAGDTLVRYGGDEFVALLAGADSHNAYVSVVQRMHEMLGEPFELPDGTVQAITASIGTVDSSGPWKTSSELINAADQAMYQSKRSQSGTRESARP